MDISESFALFSSITTMLTWFITSFFILIGFIAYLIYRCRVIELRDFKELEEQELDIKYQKELNLTDNKETL